MRIAFLSDIHGNIVALEAVLKDLAQQGQIDQIIVPGDLYAFGPAPNEVFTAIRQLPEILFLLGNTDRYLLEGSYPSTPGGEGWQDKLLASFRWTAEHLSHAGLQFLETLPPSQLIQHGNRKMLVVHGSPRSDEEGLTPTTTPDELQAMSIDPQVDYIICGHTHIPMDRMVGSIRVVNVGSVGLPFDGDPRACYAIISNLAADKSNAGHIEIRRVIYDVEKAVAQFYAADHPAADISAYNLRTGHSIGNSLIYTPEMRGESGKPYEM